MPIYFTIEGIVGRGKTTLSEWLKMMLIEDGCTFYMIPEPVNKFKKKITYNPLDVCYKHLMPNNVVNIVMTNNFSLRHVMYQ